MHARLTRRIALAAMSLAPLTAVVGLTGTAGAADQVTHYDVSDEAPFAQGVAVDSTGRVWTRGQGSLARMNPATGAIDQVCQFDPAEYPGVDNSPLFAVDAYDNVWVGWVASVDDPLGQRVVRIDPDTCDMEDFDAGTDFGAAAMASTPEGALVVSSSGRLAELTDLEGAVAVGDLIDGPFPYFDLMVLVDGAAWGARSTDGTLWRIQLSDGSAVEHEAPLFQRVNDIAVGPDGNVWFVGVHPDGGGRIGRVAADGTGLIVDDFGTSPTAIVAGPDGNLWVADGPSVHVVSPADMSVLRTIATEATAARPINGLVVSGGEVWGASIVGDGTLIRITQTDDPVDPVDPPATPVDGPAAPTAPGTPPATPVAAQPSFTG